MNKKEFRNRIMGIMSAHLFVDFHTTQIQNREKVADEIADIYQEEWIKFHKEQMELFSRSLLGDEEYDKVLERYKNVKCVSMDNILKEKKNEEKTD